MFLADETFVEQIQMLSTSITVLRIGKYRIPNYIIHQAYHPISPLIIN